MNRSVLQVPVDISLRREAERYALEQGFSSLQEAVRVFLRKLAQRTVVVTFENNIALSDRNALRYDRMIAGVKSGRVKTKVFSDVNPLMQHLSTK